MEIVLKHGGLTARVNTLGGELVSLRDRNGTEYIWGGNPAYWSGRNPVLFPIVGGLKNGRVDIGGRTYEMARHGFARRSEFVIADSGEDFVEFELRERMGTLRQYPFFFSLRVRHQLCTDGFYTQFTVTNPGTVPMPFCIGAHTAFRCPLGEGERFEDYRLVFEQPEEADAILPGADGCLCHDRREAVLRGEDTIPLDHGVYDRIDTLIFDEIDTGISGRTAQMVSQKLHMIAKNHQVICITHLPQIAALGNNHYKVYKEEGDDGTASHIIPLDEPQRVEEIAHMLSGENLTPEALANAQTLLHGGKRQ